MGTSFLILMNKQLRWFASSLPQLLLGFVNSADKNAGYSSSVIADSEGHYVLDRRYFGGNDRMRALESGNTCDRSSIRSVIWTVDKNSPKVKAEICWGFDFYHIF